MSPAFSLRPALESDFPTIRRLIWDSRINPTGLDWRRFIVAISENGEFIGCGQVKRHSDGAPELASIAVVTHWRNQGVAHAIINHLLTANPERMFLSCRAGLGPFYERFDFRQATPQDLSPYFRRLDRYADLLQRLRLAPAEGLWIMLRDP